MQLLYYTLSASDGFSFPPAARTPLRDVIPVVRINGRLSRDSWWQGVPATFISQLLSSLEKSPSTIATILEIASGGGDARAVPWVLDYLRDPSRTKKIYSVVETADSAAYWIAAATDGIYMHNDITAETGSIGTMIGYIDPSGIWRKAGAVVRDIYPKNSPDKNAESRAAQRGDFEPYERRLATMTEKFKSSVLSLRPGIDPSALTGHTYDAQRSIRLGLADGMMTTPQLAARIESAINLQKAI